MEELDDKELSDDEEDDEDESRDRPEWFVRALRDSPEWLLRVLWGLRTMVTGLPSDHTTYTLPLLILLDFTLYQLKSL